MVLNLVILFDLDMLVVQLGNIPKLFKVLSPSKIEPYTYKLVFEEHWSSAKTYTLQPGKLFHLVSTDICMGQYGLINVFTGSKLSSLLRYNHSL